MTWTPEQIAWWRNHYEDVDRASLKRALLSTLDALESQQAELDAARAVVDVRDTVRLLRQGNTPANELTSALRELRDTEDAYGTLRAEQETL